MTLSRTLGMLGMASVLAFAGIAASASAQDKDAVIKERQATMKQQAKDLGSVKAFLTGKADQAAAMAGATNLTETTGKIPSLFPLGTEAPSPDGDYRPKPAVWTEPDKFSAAQKTAVAKAEALLAAVKTGDKAAIQTAFADFGKNGCGNCHTAFREKLKN
jgi:cytochrome c556